MKKYAGPIGIALEAIKKKWGLDVDLPQNEEPIARQDATMRFHLTKLINALQKLVYTSVYVLVDKVDEAAITGLAKQTFDLISPLISDLSTLEIPGIAFKFFLWDAIESTYDASGFARRDRVPVFKLDWDIEELGRMLALRMSAYSNGTTNSFNDLVDSDGLDTHKLITLLAAGSPRNMIRLAKRILASALRSGDDIELIPLVAVWAGVRIYADELANELFSQYLSDLRRVGRLPPTTNAWEAKYSVLTITLLVDACSFGPIQGS